MSHALLVESNTKATYPNLGLMKISTLLKRNKHQVDYYNGKKETGEYDKIYISATFTFEAKRTIELINFYQARFPDADVFVGGSLPSLFPKFIEAKTGIKSFVGYSKGLDAIPPDYDLIKTNSSWDNYSFVYTTRGCANKCSFCVVPKIEGDMWINQKWKNQIHFGRPNVAFMDNNLTAAPLSHFEDVINFIKKNELAVLFSSGLDCRLFNDAHLELIKEIKIVQGGLRFAFDEMSQDGFIQDVIKKCLKANIGKEKIKVYVMVGFNESEAEENYRINTIKNLGGHPIILNYVSNRCN